MPTFIRRKLSACPFMVATHPPTTATKPHPSASKANSASMKKKHHTLLTSFPTYCEPASLTSFPVGVIQQTVIQQGASFPAGCEPARRGPKRQRLGGQWKRRGARGAEWGGAAATGQLRAPVAGRGSKGQPKDGMQSSNGCRRPERHQDARAPRSHRKMGGRVDQCAHRHREGLQPTWPCAREARGQHLHRCLLMGQGPEI